MRGDPAMGCVWYHVSSVGGHVWFGKLKEARKYNTMMDTWSLSVRMRFECAPVR